MRENEAARERENERLFPLQSDLTATNYCRISPAHTGEPTSTPRCVFIPSSASCRSSVPVYSHSTAPTLLKPFSKHSSKAGKTKKEGVCARRDTTSPRPLVPIFSTFPRSPGLSFSLASRSQPATSPGLPTSRSPDLSFSRPLVFPYCS